MTVSIGKIVSAVPSDKFTLRTKWDDGAQALLDLSALVDSKSKLAPLRQISEFSRGKVSTDQWSVEWPCGIDFGAQQLRRWAEDQHVLPAAVS